VSTGRAVLRPLRPFVHLGPPYFSTFFSSRKESDVGTLALRLVPPIRVYLSRSASDYLFCGCAPFGWILLAVTWFPHFVWNGVNLTVISLRIHEVPTKTPKLSANLLVALRSGYIDV
jgi:hypothetical protein